MKSYIKLNYLCDEIVSLHSHICGDGYLYEKYERPSPSTIKLKGKTDRFIRHIVEYSNNNQELLNFVSNLIKKISPKSYICRGEKFVRVRNKALFLLLKKLGAGKTTEWRIPKEIIYNSKYRKLWLRSFFDDEGSIKPDSIEVYTSNKNGLLKVQEMFDLENIRYTIFERKPSHNHKLPLFRLRICTYDCFKFKKIGFNHPEKKIKLKEFLKKRVRRLGFEPR